MHVMKDTWDEGKLNEIIFTSEAEYGGYEVQEATRQELSLWCSCHQGTLVA